MRCSVNVIAVTDPAAGLGGGEKHEIYAADFGSLLFTGRNEVLAKVIFLHLSVILLTGRECLTRHAPPEPGRYTHPPPRTRQVHPTPPSRDQAGTPPGPGRYTPHPPGPGRYTPRTRQVHPQTRQVHPPWDQAGTSHPPGSSRPRNTVNDRPVRILLECILVMAYFYRAGEAWSPWLPRIRYWIIASYEHGIPTVTLFVFVHVRYGTLRHVYTYRLRLRQVVYHCVNGNGRSSCRMGSVPVLQEDGPLWNFH